MATIGFATDLSNIKRDGIATWKFKHGTDIGHYSFGKLRDGKISILPLIETDSYQRQNQHGIRIEASAKAMNTHKSKIIELAGALGTLGTHQIITAQNGVTYTGDLGLRWRFVCEGGMEKQRYIEIFADGYLWVDHASYADLTTLLATPSAGTANATDVFYTWDPTDPAGYIGAAAKEIKLNLAGEAEDVGSIRKFRLIIEGQANVDDYGISVVDTVNIQTDFEMRQTTDELAFMEVAVKNVYGYTITLADGAILALPSQLGFQFEHSLLTDTKDIAFIKVTGGGSITPSAFATLWT